MIRPSRTWRSAAVLGVASLALAACGGDGGAQEEPADGGTPAATETAAGGAEVPEDCGDGTLTVGTLLPQTGNLAFLGPPEFAGVELAIQEINEAGGVLDNEVAKIDADSGDTTTDIASQSVERLLSQDVDAIIGAASSGVSFTVIDRITGAGALQISPANTSPDFTDYDDGGLYFRTAPSDVLQGRVMGELLINDGYLDIGIMALDDPYGTGLAENVQQSVEAGGGTVVESIIYNPQAANFSAEVGQLKAANPEAIVLIGFDETKKIVPELIAQGVGPQDVPLYFVDGNTADYSADFQEGTLDGVKGTQPGAEVSEEFRNRLLEVDPSLTVFNYGPESYDATVLTALGAIAAGADCGEAIASELVAVSGDGEACSTFAECKEMLEAGTDIDYQGVSGPIEFNDAGDPTRATVGIYEYGPENTPTPGEFVEGQI
jgi:ABC-type branched-subunit amino acid transport system substrate-binding protein